MEKKENPKSQSYHQGCGCGPLTGFSDETTISDAFEDETSPGSLDSQNVNFDNYVQKHVENIPLGCMIRCSPLISKITINLSSPITIDIASIVL